MRSSWPLVLIFLLAVRPLKPQEVPAGSNSQAKPSLCGSIPQSGVSPRIQPPRLVHAVTPKYPKEARHAKLEGTVRLSIVIDRDGTVSEIRVLQGEPTLADAAATAVRQWRYEPIEEGAKGFPALIAVSFRVREHGGVQFSQEIADQRLSTNPLSSSPSIASPGEPYPIYHIGGDVKPPTVVYSPSLTYPESARLAKKEGTVILALVVTSEGTVREPEVCRGLDQALDEEAVAHVSQWKFQPATKDGKPVAVQVKVQVDFRLYRK